jgi:hypothetical protein
MESSTQQDAFLRLRPLPKSIRVPDLVREYRGFEGYISAKVFIKKGKARKKKSAPSLSRASSTHRKPWSSTVDLCTTNAKTSECMSSPHPKLRILLAVNNMTSSRSKFPVPMNLRGLRFIANGASDGFTTDKDTCKSLSVNIYWRTQAPVQRRWQLISWSVSSTF